MVEKRRESSRPWSPHQNFWDHKSLHRVDHIFFLAVNFPTAAAAASSAPCAIAGWL